MTKHMIKLGEGKTSIVYSDGVFAYKEYHEAYVNNISYEIQVQNEIFQTTNLNVCRYELDNQRIKMTLIDGVLFADRIRIEKYKNWLEDFTDLQCQIYQQRNINLMDAHEVFYRTINESNLDYRLKSNALTALESIPKGSALCHFDFHPLNIMFKDDKYYIIDWINAKLSNPVMDIANTYIIFREHLQRQSQKYLNMMAKKTGLLVSDIIQALPVMASMKLLEHNDSIRHTLLLDLIESNDPIFHKK